MQTSIDIILGKFLNQGFSLEQNLYIEKEMSQL